MSNYKKKDSSRREAEEQTRDYYAYEMKNSKWKY